MGDSYCGCACMLLLLACCLLKRAAWTDHRRTRHAELMRELAINALRNRWLCLQALLLPYGPHSKNCVETSVLTVQNVLHDALRDTVHV